MNAVVSLQNRRRSNGLGTIEKFNESGPDLKNLKVKIFADGADKTDILELAENPFVRGFTTNPTLMRTAGVTDYETFARDVLSVIVDRPVSFEVIADDFDEMYAQARTIASWGPNVYVKIPVTNTKAQSSVKLLERLSGDGVKLNVTAIMSLEQVRAVVQSLASGAPACISVFAGRVADTGRDPLPLMSEALEILREHPNLELLWASSREVLNIFQADQIGCHIITVTRSLLDKLPAIGKNLDDFSLDTVKMFYRDAQLAGFAP